MIVRINYRESFARVVGYAMKREKSPEIVGGNLSARDPNSMIGEFGLLAEKNTRCKMPVAHLAFSLAKGERLTADQWACFAQGVASECGFEQYIAIRHHDTDCEHIHIVGNRIQLNGKAVSTSNDRHRMRALCQQAEKDFGLGQTAERSQQLRVNKDELEHSERLYREGMRTHPVPQKLILAEQIRANAYLASDHADFIKRCQRQGITVRWRWGQDGHRVGVSFGEAGSPIFFTGTRLGMPLSQLNRTLYGHRKIYHSHPRRPDSRLDRGLHSGIGLRSAGASASAVTTPHGVGNAGAATQSESGELARCANHPDRGSSGSLGKKEKQIMMAATTLLFSGLVCKLIHGLESLDDTLSPSISIDWIERNRRTFL